MLIDADNASANSIEFILKKVDTFGHIGCKKIYGDWGNTYLQRWQEALLKYAIHPIQLFSYAKGKNATDIGMVIDTMDLLHSGDYDGFCLVSSDSDFTSLALRIRHSHIKVIGFGKKNTVTAFVQACDHFYYVEDLLPIVAIPNNTIASTEDTSNTKTATNERPIQNNIEAINEILIKKWDGSRLKCDTKLMSSLRTSIINHPKAKAEHWLNFALVSHGMKAHYPDFNPKNYGYTKLTDIVKNIDLFEMKVEVSTVYVREKKSKTLPVVAKPQPKPSIIHSAAYWTTKRLQTQNQLIKVLNNLIKKDPNSDKGWSNISYLASQIKQHHVDIKLDKYGYKKFSDLIAALDLYETRRQNKAISIKLKSPKLELKVVQQPPKPQVKPKLNPSEAASKTIKTNIDSSKHLPDAQTSFAIYSSSTTDVILFCMNTQHDTHLVEDTIYTHQKNSKDGAIILRQQLSNGITKSNFACALHQQAATIDQLVFIIVSQHNDLLADKACPTIEIDIRSWGTGISFSETFKVPTEKGKNLLLFSVNKVDNEWQFMPQNILVSGDFQNLCKNHGINLSND